MVLVKNKPVEEPKVHTRGGRSRDRLRDESQIAQSLGAQAPAQQRKRNAQEYAGPAKRVQPQRRDTSRSNHKASRSASNKQSKKSLRVAIVHDWLIGGGAELVVEQLHKIYPDAPIYTSCATAEWRRRLDGKVVTGWIARWPFSKLRKFIPLLRIWWFSKLNLEDYDLVISSSGAEAKGIKLKNPVHVAYIHAPTHYYWGRYDEYMRHPGFGPFNFLARAGLWLLVKPLRKWDYAAAQRPDYLLANSRHTRADIKKYYGREASVLHPPVNFERFTKLSNSDRPRRGFVVSGRQTPYKRFDLAVEACSKLDLPLTVIGDGPDHKRLRKLAGPSVTFLGRAADKVVEEEFASAEALLFPGWDDFGITPVEAMAAGTPVIAFKKGGALDYVVPGRTGEFFDEQTMTSLARVLHDFRPSKYSVKDCRTCAKKFSSDVFRQKFQHFVEGIQDTPRA